MWKPLAVIAVLLLGGCGLETGQSVDSTALGVVVKKIQDLTVKACSFLPANSSVVAIVAASDPLVMSAVKIAEAICAAVTKPTPAPATDPALFGREKTEAASCPMVAGVCVEGEFIDPNALPKENAQ